MAANAGSIRAGRAFVELFVNGGQLTAGLKAASAKLKAWGAGIKSFGTRLAAAGGAVAAPMIAAAKAASSSGAEIYDMSRRTGVAVEALSALGYAADMSGTDMETVEVAMRRMSKSIMGVADETEGTTGKLDQVGLKFKDLHGLSPDQQFERIASAVAAIANPTQRAAAAMSIFGRSGTAIIPMIEDFAQLNEEAKGFGLIKSGSSAKDAKEFANLLTILSKCFKSLASAIGSAVMPVIRPFLEDAIYLVVGVRDWIKANTDLIRTIFRIAMVVVGVGTALVGLGMLIGKIGGEFSLLGSIIPIVGTVLSAVAGVIAFLLTPVGAVVAAVALLAGYWLYSSGAMGQAADWLGGVFDGLKKDAVAAFGGISDALAAGDFALAAQILWTTLKIWWTKGTNWISGIWNDCMGWLTQRFYESIGGWRIIFEEIGHGLTVAWINITAGLAETWHSFVYGLQVAWNWCGKMLEKAWNKIKGVFDSSFDSDAANQAVEEAYQQKIDALKKEKDDKIAAVDAEYNSEMASENALNQKNLKDIVDQTEAAKSSDQAERDAKEKANAAELAALQQQRDAQVKKAKDERTQKELSGKLKKPGEVKDPKDFLKGMNLDMDAVKKGFTISGTFSGMAAWGLAGGSAADRTAKATEKTAKGVEKLVDIVDREGGPTFA